MKIHKKRKWGYIGLVYISPWIIGFLVFQFYPIVASLIYSFTDFDMMGNANFVALKNYIYMFTKDRDFYNSLKVTFLYVFYAVPLKLAFALAVAMILNARLKAINIFRTVYYLPSIFGGSVATALLWRFLFMREGAMNNLLAVFGLPDAGWLSSPKLALFTLSLLTVWQFGSSMVLFLAGLQQIPGELYEAAKIDGASRIRTFFKITIPLLSPIIFFNMVMQTVNSFQEFTGAFVITNRGPLNSTYLYVMKLYYEGFQYFKMGYACALSWILFAIIITVTLIAFKTSKSWVFYTSGGGR
ncbi:MAG: sugar ABC transporter permease [Spirochaetales bacterium]|nr:sugar ABC transporter permease [Spirochaetales bacterium]